MLIYRYRTILHEQRQKSDYGGIGGVTRECWDIAQFRDPESKETWKNSENQCNVSYSLTTACSFECEEHVVTNAVPFAGYFPADGSYVNVVCFVCI